MAHQCLVLHGDKGLAGLGDGWDQSLHPIWCFCLAEMLFLLPPSRAGSSPAQLGHDPCHWAPSFAQGPASSDQRLFALCCWVRLISGQGFLESPWAGGWPDLNPPLEASNFTRVMQTILIYWDCDPCAFGIAQGPQGSTMPGVVCHCQRVPLPPTQTSFRSPRNAS